MKNTAKKKKTCSAPLSDMKNKKTPDLTRGDNSNDIAQGSIVRDFTVLCCSQTLCGTVPRILWELRSSMVSISNIGQGLNWNNSQLTETFFPGGQNGTDYGNFKKDCRSTALAGAEVVGGSFSQLCGIPLVTLIVTRFFSFYQSDLF